jgi:hypothetical protein
MSVVPENIERFAIVWFDVGTASVIPCPASVVGFEPEITRPTESVVTWLNVPERSPTDRGVNVVGHPE